MTRYNHPESSKIMALNLRKQGETYAAIGKKLSISKSTAKRWLKDKRFNDNERELIEKRLQLEKSKSIMKATESTKIIKARGREILTKSIVAELEEY